MKKEADGIGSGEKIGYGMGDLASNFVWTSAMTYLAFFYTDIFGIGAAMVGILLLVARFWDAIFDPIMGMISERTRSRHGVFRPWLLWMALPFGIMAVLTFTTPSFGVVGKTVWAFETYILLGMIYSAVNVPYSVMTATMTQDPDERVSLSTVRMICAFCGALAVNVATLPLIKALGGADQRAGYQLTMALFGAVAAILFIVCFATTRERILPESDERMPIRDSFRAAKGNWPWFLIIIMAILMQTINTMKSGVTMYFFTYNLGRQDLIPVFMMALALPMLVGLPLGNILAQKFDKKPVIIAGSILGIVFNGLFFFLNPHDMPTILALTILSGIGLGMTVPASFAMSPDTIEYGEWKTGIRAAGFLTSGAFFGGKVGTSIGGALIGFILAATGYAAGAAQNEATLFAFRFMMAGLPAIAGVLTIILIALYPIDRKLFAKIMKELAERKAGATGAVGGAECAGTAGAAAAE